MQKLLVKKHKSGDYFPLGDFGYFIFKVILFFETSGKSTKKVDEESGEDKREERQGEGVTRFFLTCRPDVNITSGKGLRHFGY